MIHFCRDLRKWVSHRKQNMLGITTMQKSIPVKQSQYSAFTLVDSAKEEEERLLRRKQEEQKRFQEIQLSNHPLLDNFPKNEKILKDLLGLNSQKSNFHYYKFLMFQILESLKSLHSKYLQPL